MKALFLIDNVPAIEMFMPIVTRLNGESVFINYSRNKPNTFKIEEYMNNLAVRCEIIKKHNKRCVNALLDQEKPGIVIFIVGLYPITRLAFSMDALLRTILSQSLRATYSTPPLL